MPSSSRSDIERLAYAVSHDLGAPIRHIRQFIGLLRPRLGEIDERSQHYLDRIEAASDLLADRMGDVLRFSRVSTQGGPFVRTDPNTAFEAACVRLREPIRASGASVAWEGVPEVFADPEQLAEMLFELMDNAMKFRSADHAPSIVVSCAATPGGWRFEVADDGIGIPARFEREPFDLWRRLNDPEDYPGRGAGLAICEVICNRHGGAVGFEPGPEGGTVFWFELGAEGRDE